MRVDRNKPALPGRDRTQGVAKASAMDEERVRCLPRNGPSSERASGCKCSQPGHQFRPSTRLLVEWGHVQRLAKVWSRWSVGRSQRGYLLNGVTSSVWPRSGRGGRWGARNAAVHGGFVRLTHGMRSRRSPSGVERLKRGLPSSK